MKEGVSKKEFIESLESTLKLTRESVTKLELKDDETVLIHFKGGYIKSVNITCNSAMAIVRDVARTIK